MEELTPQIDTQATLAQAQDMASQTPEIPELPSERYAGITADIAKHILKTCESHTKRD